MNQLEKEVRKSIRNFKFLEQDNTAEAYFSFSPDFIGFKGHFSDNPVLPGICIIKALLVKLMIWQEKIVNLKEMGSVKFFLPVKPNDLLLFHSKLTLDKNEDCYIVTSKVTCENEKIAQMRLRVLI
jgi:3-hydroxyacyl-[acyl-carrier-protein] dehydratase